MPSQTKKLISFTDRFVEKGIIFLLIFTPLAFGTVQPWSIAVMEIIAFTIFFFYLIKQIHIGAPLCSFNQAGFLTGLVILFAAMLALVLFQMLPLPEGLLKLLSPAALATYMTFGNYPAGSFHPVTLNPWATRQELIRVLSYAAVFFVIISHFRTKEQVNSIVKTILYMGCFLVIFAVVQKMTWNGRIFWFYPVDEALRSGTRIWGPYINRNNFAGYLEMAIPLGMGMLLHAAPRIKALTDDPLRLKIARFLASRNIVPYALFFLLVLVMAAALLMSFSRGAILAFVCSSLFFVQITYRRKTLKNKTSLLAILAVVIIAAVLLAAWGRLEYRFAALEEDHIGRLGIWQNSMGMVRDYLFLGTGLGTFENAYMHYQTARPLLLFDHAHNDYLELLTDMGVVGFLIGMGMALLFFRGVFRRWRRKHSMFGKCVGAGGLSSIVAILVHSFTDFNLHIPANALLFTVIAAITFAAVFNVTDHKALDL